MEINASPPLALRTLQRGTRRFYSEETNVAERFLDQKFPEVRQLFRLKYKEKNAIPAPSSNQAIDEILLEFWKIQADISKALEYSVRESHPSTLYPSSLSDCERLNSDQAV